MKKLLLHTCCAPCLTQCLEVLTGRDSWEKALLEKPCFEVSILFDNPNIFPPAEYDIRKAHLERYLDLFVRESGTNVFLLEDRSGERRDAWEAGAIPMAGEPEKGLRCGFCYEFRLLESFERAREEGFDAVASTLTLSPHKNTARINEIGERLSSETPSAGPAWLWSDFKKGDGFKKSIALSQKYQIYRQDWCGCRFSDWHSKTGTASAQE